SNLFTRKSALRPDMARDRADSKNRIYPLSINTRNAHESSSKIACFLFDFLRAKTTTTKAFSRQNTHRLFHQFCEQQKPSCRWLASLRDTNHLLQCFFRAIVNHKIGTHAGGAGPRDFLFDEFGNGEQYAEFFHVPRSVGRVSGRSPDQVGNV
ncbi:hypothetical protein, partial [Escherichia coli]|uniref:hypothetical protein n=1 Tax=Escherichia coli TaxID=562 RepID=UPI002023EC92